MEQRFSWVGIWCPIPAGVGVTDLLNGFGRKKETLLFDQGFEPLMPASQAFVCGKTLGRTFVGGSGEGL